MSENDLTELGFKKGWDIYMDDDDVKTYYYYLERYENKIHTNNNTSLVSNEWFVSFSINRYDNDDHRFYYKEDVELIISLLDKTTKEKADRDIKLHKLLDY
jgi:hypothetical protein